METTVSSEFIPQLEKQIREECPEDKSQKLIPFAHKVFELFPTEELEHEPISDIGGFVRSLWQFFQKKTPGKAKIRIFNPVLEEDGWENPYTNIFILQRDMPFLVDSVTIELNRQGLGIQAVKSSVLRVSRDAQGNLQQAMTDDCHDREALMFFQIDRFSSAEVKETLLRELNSVLDNVEAVTDDYRPMVKTLDGIIAEAKENNAGFDDEKQQAFLEFLTWLRDGYFTFLGYTCFDLRDAEQGPELANIAEGKLGLFRLHRKDVPSETLASLNPGIRAFYAEDAEVPVAFSKSAWRARVHRQAYSDYVVIKRFGKDGQPVGEHRFLGLYTSSVYHLSPFKIPLIRERVSKIFSRSGLEPDSHDGKALRQIIEVHPREELFHSTDEQLYQILIGIWQIKERRRVRLFVRSDPFEKFVSCFVYMPRDVYRTEIRNQVQTYLCQEMDASESEFYTYFAESVLARTQYILRISSDRYKNIDQREMERHIAEMTRDWRDDLQLAAIERWGEERGRALALNYRDAFSAGYQDAYDPRTAVHDVDLFCGLSGRDQIAMSFYQPPGAAKNVVCFKIFHLEQNLELSHLVPILENLGFRVLGEHPYEIEPREGCVVWLHEFTLKFGLDIAVDVVAVRNNFQDAFAAIWSGTAENDEFNRLVIGARLEWRSVALLRLYAEYMKQLGLSFSRQFIAHTLATNLDITRNLVALFKSYFDPKYAASEEDQRPRGDRLHEKVLTALDNVANLNEDQVLRTYLQLLAATLRTNFFQRDAEGNPKPYIAVKLAPDAIPAVPEPRPQYEIFVHSPRFEGVHLRAGKVARGGIRWSDRLEDYRTEVLGLVKAQQVKNSVIVPTGAKGGFVAKQIDRLGTREAMLEEGVACYRLFIQGLLDITDNRVGDTIVPPIEVIRRDGDDPYLVVAADKGTATFSDIANSISADYQHWLGDAFASGGSYGYDHKKMGITARGAWVAVQRHFRELGLNTQEDDFTVVGIGDMAGDVFGNGMLMSQHIQLVAAFNHLHIFIDPNPDAAVSFAERQRLFALPRSSWEDYDKALISEGGGVFSRNAKSIDLSPQIRERFAIDATRLTPNQLIHCLLKAEVDLIWNGGIGTYVKASVESHAEVGDRANEALRVDGTELRCRVFGEGGNLGLTQRGRIEYCLNGGACNTDFIDNAGGVDCSDHEVNIKIALNQLVANEDLTPKQRNLLLEEMTDSVAEGVLHNNYRQTQAISLAGYQGNVPEFWRCITDWEAAGRLNRKLEYLPDDETLAERIKSGQDLTRPELSVLVSYSKILLKEALAEADIYEDAYIAKAVYDAFPDELVKQYPNDIANHSLRREVIANQLANEIVNLMGLSFPQRQMTSTGAEVGDVVRAYLVMRDTLELLPAWREVESLDYRQPAEVQFDLFAKLMRLGRRVARWVLRNRRSHRDTAEEIATLSPIIHSTIKNYPQALDECQREEFDSELKRLLEMGLSESTAMLLSCSDSLYFGYGIAAVQLKTGLPTELVSQVYFQLGRILELEWFAEQIILLPHASRWEDFARESFVDELEGQRRQLAWLLLERIPEGADPAEAVAANIDAWQQRQAVLICRWEQMVNELKGIPERDFAMFSVALRELLDLVQATRHQDESTA